MAHDMNLRGQDDGDAQAFWMTAKRNGSCWECFTPIDAGDRMVWDNHEHRAYCIACGEEVAGYADPNGEV